MSMFLGGLFDCIKRKKGYFFLIIVLTIISIVLGVIAAVNFGGGVFSIDISKIAYIKYLKDDCGFMSMVFGLILSLLIFFMVCLIFHRKSWFVPLGLMFYLYLVYSQAVIFMSIILIYGFFNCVILVLLLLIYTLLIWFVFMLILCELICLTNRTDYFRCCFSLKESNLLWHVVGIVLLTFIFSLILIVLKNYVILLIY